MISEELKALAIAIELDQNDNFKLRIEFGIACVQRVEGFLTDAEVIHALAIGKEYIRNKTDLENLKRAANSASKAAQSHVGSGSLDGSGSAAVSVSRGVAAALHGRALEAAGYAAYASVYSYSASAVTDLAAYVPEQSWQFAKLNELAESTLQKQQNTET